MLDSGFRIKYNEENDFCLHVLGYVQGNRAYIEKMGQCKAAAGLQDRLEEAVNSAEPEKLEQLAACMEELFGENQREEGWLEAGIRLLLSDSVTEQNAAVTGDDKCGCHEVQQVRKDCVDWLEVLTQEQQDYHQLWMQTYEQMQTKEEDFNDFMNWRIHQIEFFYGYTRQVPRASALLSVRLGIVPDAALWSKWKPEKQYVPVIVSKEEYNQAYFTFLLQQTEPVCRRLMEECGYAGEELLGSMRLAAAYILVEACHGVLREDFSERYGLQEANLANVGEKLSVPAELYDRLSEYLLGME